MNTPQQIAKHLREVYCGGNWTSVNLKDTLSNVSWEQAVTKIKGFNTIATLVYHTKYYINVVTEVLQGNPLNAKDIYSFDHPPVTSSEDWQQLLDKVWCEVESFARLIEQLPESNLEAPFTDEKYGNYYRNLHGIIEHMHYHLGQIVLLKKMIQNDTASL